MLREVIRAEMVTELRDALLSPMVSRPEFSERSTLVEAPVDI